MTRDVRKIKENHESVQTTNSNDDRVLEIVIYNMDTEIKITVPDKEQYDKIIFRIEARTDRLEEPISGPREVNEGSAPDSQMRRWRDAPIPGSRKPTAADLRDRGLAHYYGNAGARRRDYRLAAKYFRKAGDRGDATAQVYMGEMYLDGNGVQRDFEEAIRWLRRAAEQGHGLAIEQLEAIVGTYYNF